MEFTVSILQNLALLSFIGLGFFITDRYLTWQNEQARNVINGVILGLTTFLVTSTPIYLTDGATVDARAGPVLISAFVAGPIGALITATLGASARAFVGGGFAFSGVIVFFFYALVGLFLYHLQVLHPRKLLRLRPVLVLCLTSFLAAGSMFFLIHPQERAIKWLMNDLPDIFLANTFSVILTVIIVELTFRILDTFHKTLEANRTLSLAKRAGRFGIWDYDIEKDELKWDHRSAEIHGVPLERAPRNYREWSEIVHPLDIDIVGKQFDEALSGALDFETEYRTSIPGVPEQTVRGNAILLRNREQNPVRVVGTNLDLTELRRTESELQQVRTLAVQAQKFDTIGKLTGGVAHDFNNLLAIIMGNQELLIDELSKARPDTGEAISYAEASVQAVRRGSELTNSMLSYARQARLEPSVIDVNQVVRETERWIVRTIASSIDVETVLQAGVWSVRVDRSSFQSALVNLIVNAKDAMSDGGKLTIETANVRIDETYLAQRDDTIPAGRYVLIAVSDTGKGITKDALERIYDPFFTTKPVGQGTGLGLSMVEGFVRQSGGSIHVYSEEGVGTSFKLYFEAVDTDRTSHAVSAETPHTETDQDITKPKVLVVEDNAEVLSVIVKALKSSGFIVTQATSGDEGYRYFRQNSDFDLVLTDIVMPGDLQGPALAKACREIVPDMPFIFFSGYASEATVHGNGLLPEDIRLMKPVSKTDLIAAITRRLERSTP